MTCDKLLFTTHQIRFLKILSTTCLNLHKIIWIIFYFPIVKNSFHCKYFKCICQHVQWIYAFMFNGTAHYWKRHCNYIFTLDNWWRYSKSKWRHYNKLMKTLHELIIYKLTNEDITMNKDRPQQASLNKGKTTNLWK